MQAQALIAAHDRRQQLQGERVAGTSCYRNAQLSLCRLSGLNTLFPQQVYPFICRQACDGILLHVGWRVILGSSRHGPAGQQDAAATEPAIEDVKPLSKPRISSLSCLAIQQVLKLIYDYKTEMIWRIQHVEECSSLVLRWQLCNIGNGFAQDRRYRLREIGEGS